MSSESGVPGPMHGEIPRGAVIAALEGFGIPNPGEIRGVHIGIRWLLVERWDSDDEHYWIGSSSDYERHLSAQRSLSPWMQAHGPLETED